MVYIELWDEYQNAVEQLYLSAPLKTRYVSKYRHSEGKLVLKVFDGTTCLKYRTDRLPDLKKFERLNLSMMHKMQAKKLVDKMDVDVLEPIAATAVSKEASASNLAPSSVKKSKGKKRNR